MATSKSLEARWLAFASVLTTHIGDGQLRMLRGAFFAGAASAWRLTAEGRSKQLEQDINAFIDSEQQLLDGFDG